MAFLNMNGFTFPVNPMFNGLFDNFVSQCQPNTVGVGVTQPVQIRVSTGVNQPVSQPIGQSVSQPVSQSVLQMSAQSTTVVVPVSQGVTNPVRQTVGSTVEVPIGQIAASNSTLQQFATNFGAVAVTAIATGVVKAQENAVIESLSREIAVSNEVVQNADEFAQVVDKGKILAEKLRGAKAETVRQIAQKMGFGFTKTNGIADAMRRGDAALKAFLDTLPEDELMKLQQGVDQNLVGTIANRCTI